MVDRPLGDHFIDYMAVLEPLLRAVEPRVADQVFAAHDLQKPFPMLRIGARSVDVAVIVRTVAFALVSLAGRVGAHDALIAHPRPRFSPQRLGGVGDAAIIDHAFLHRQLDALAFAGELTLIEGREYAGRAVQPGPGIADRQTGLDRAAIWLAGNRHRPAGP